MTENLETVVPYEQDSNLSEDQDDLRHHPHRRHPHDVACDEEESLLSRGTEAVAENGRLYVGVFVEEFHALLQAPEAALHAAQDRLRVRGEGEEFRCQGGIGCRRANRSCIFCIVFVVNTSGR